MKYSYEYEIKYQEVDGQKKLRLYNLENYLLEAAGTVADELDFGIARLHRFDMDPDTHVRRDVRTAYALREDPHRDLDRE